MLFAIHQAIPKMANDANTALIETYEVIRDQPEQLLTELKKRDNTKDHFLDVRSWDRDPDFLQRPAVERAARFIYLNKTCFNGLYRVNAKGQFNVPFGNFKNPRYADSDNIMSVSEFLNRDVKLFASDYRQLTRQATKKDFVYFDPPYDPVSATSSFVSYQNTGFNQQDQLDLRDEALRLTSIGTPILLSNSDTPLIRSLYSDQSVFIVESVSVTRSISARASSRQKVGEVLISNFGAIDPAPLL